MSGPSRLVVGPFNRVEGDLEVTLELRDGRVAAARAGATLYRGFEQILQGRPPTDALVVAPRICGICSVAQSLAAARALADWAGLGPTANGALAADLLLAGEVVADHLTHFLLFFLPDLAHPAYAGRPWHPAAQRRWRAVEGESSRTFLPARARFLHLMGILAGKWPHSLALQPGGTTKAIDAGERIRLLAILGEFRDFLEAQVFGGPLEAFAALDGPEALAAWAGDGDLRLFLHAAAELGLDRLGRGWDRFMSSGGPLFAAGTWCGGTAGGPADLTRLTEDVSHAWLAGPSPHPRAGLTLPDAERPDGYTWCKAPRLAGAPMEVGALARQVVDGHKLALGLVRAGGASVLARVAGRLLETARLLPAMEAWVRALRPREPFCDSGSFPADGAGTGLVEAARGTLGHWLTVAGGRIANYQVIAPTTWNFSPRDANHVPGPLEKALEGVPAAAGDTMMVQHVVRSFDPCLACTVH